MVESEVGALHEHSEVDSTAFVVDDSGVPYELDLVRCAECGAVLSEVRTRIIA